MQNSSDTIRPSSSSPPMGTSNGNNHNTLRNAISHNPMDTSEKYLKILFDFIQALFHDILEIKIDHHLEAMVY
jgi:hypothetical protein